MKKLMSTLMLVGLVSVLSATPILQKFLPGMALGNAVAAGTNEGNGDNNQGGTDEGDGRNGDGEH